MIIPMNLGEKSYNIYLTLGGINKAGEYFRLDRRVLIVTDSGVPQEYSRAVLSQSKEGYIVTIPQGEGSKNIDNFQMLLSFLTEHSFTRTDCLVAVGGGVVGDLAGFVASVYMRGIDFYNIPTTLLSQVDSSIGGKVAIDFMGYKNTVGAFYQPKAVIVDPQLLSTLPARQKANGLAESVKMAVTSSPELFEIFEGENYLSDIEKIIEHSLRIKKSVVEEDEREAGLRKILNFGHTIGHAIESRYGIGGEEYKDSPLEGLYHGECVSIGMLPMCDESIRDRVKGVLEKIGLPTSYPFGKVGVAEALSHDKKASGNSITVIYAKNIGEWEMKSLSLSELQTKIKEQAL